MHYLEFFIIGLTKIQYMFKDTLQIAKATKDIMLGINARVWGGVEEANKVSRIIKGGISGADAIIGTSHALEDLACKDYVCASIDVLGSLSSTVGLVLGNIPSTRTYTSITGSVTVGCRCVRYYCKTYGTVWGCAAVVGEAVKQSMKN